MEGTYFFQILPDLEDVPRYRVGEYRDWGVCNIRENGLISATVVLMAAAMVMMVCTEPNGSFS